MAKIFPQTSVPEIHWYHKIDSENMKTFFSITFLAFFGYVICRPDDKYTTKYDHIDIDEILKSDRLFNNYFKCFMTGESCTAQGQIARGNLPDAFETGCTKCSDKQKVMMRRILSFLIENKPDMYKQIAAKYDPEGIYQNKWRSQLEAEGVKLLKK